MTDRDSERTYATKKYAVRMPVTWEIFGYAEDDWRPDRQANTYYNPATDTTIRDEDMPWELLPEEPGYDVANYIFDEFRQYGRRALAAMVDRFLGERRICG